MIVLKRGGLFERLLTVYGRTPSYNLNNFCSVFCGAVRGCIAILLITILPMLVVMIDMFIYFSFAPESVGHEIIADFILSLGINHHIKFLLALAWFGVAFLVLFFQALAIAACSAFIVIYPLLHMRDYIKSKVNWNTPNLTEATSSFVDVVKEAYDGVKEKYCPTIKWVNPKDKQQ